MKQDIITLSYTLPSIDETVKQFWLACQGYHLFCFNGDMGAGKTTFIHHLCDYLEVEDTVSSPTFSLINEYHFRKDGKDTIIYHIDLYRLKNMEELLGAGIEDCLIQAKEKKAYCFLEWPEKAGQLLPKPHLWLDIDTVSVGERKMAIEVVH